MQLHILLRKSWDRPSLILENTIKEVELQLDEKLSRLFARAGNPQTHIDVTYQYAMIMVIIVNY